MSFTKLHNKLIRSTVWNKPNHIRICWITMLALADRDGLVLSSIPGLATLARLDVEEVEEALESFRQPDKYSQTKLDEGRRIRDVEGGWELITYEVHRRLFSQEERREKDAARKRRARTGVSASVPKSPPSPHIAEAEAEADTDTKADTDKPPTPLSKGERDVIELFEYWISKTGRTKGSKMDPKRKKLLKARLGSYSLDQCKTAIDGIMLSPHHRGENDRKTVYTAVDHIFKDVGKMEDFMMQSRHQGGDNGQQEQTPEQKAATKKRVDRLVAMGLERKA